MKNKIIILAAGQSARLGRPKQLLPYKQTTLLSHTISVCLESKVGEVFVVLGAYHTEIHKSIKHLNCTVILNKDWVKGIGKSIACGINHLNQTKTNNIIIVLADQPHLTEQILNQLVLKRKQTSALIVMCEYLNGSGPPVLFDQTLFPDLAELDEDQGAKRVIQNYTSKVETIKFQKGYIDVDRIEDLKELL